VLTPRRTDLSEQANFVRLANAEAYKSTSKNLIENWFRDKPRRSYPEPVVLWPAPGLDDRLSLSVRHVLCSAFAPTPRVLSAVPSVLESASPQ
jgi:hypothetical protein